METWITLSIVALAFAYILRGIFKSSTGKGCASGCGACGNRNCAARKQEVRVKADRSR
jgi:hypothetical protein